MPLALTHSLRTPHSQDAQARQDFVSSLRAFVLNDMAVQMKARYDCDIAPRLRSALHREPDSDAIRKAMARDLFFQFYSATRVNAQEMVWRAVIPSVEADLAELERRIEAISGKAGGSLKLDPDLPMPDNVSAIDVHLMPGGYLVDQGAAAGAIYDNGLAVFSAGYMGLELDDIGSSMVQWVRHRHPSFAPTRILDCGCTIGHNTLPWKRAYPTAQVAGIDVSAPLLRYAHARAESLGQAIDFRQMDATRLDFPDASFDVVFSSMFLHELTQKQILAYLAEARRVLAPGGLLLTMELPPNRILPSYDQFYLDWDCYHNNEPFYRAFRDQDPAELLREAGFLDSNVFSFTTPQYTYMSEADYAEALEQPPQVGGDTGRLSSTVHWFGFGAWKHAQ
jgi:ubiquinone/menaquinone biosynthesis C-methylase UbiE